MYSITSGENSEVHVNAEVPRDDPDNQGTRSVLSVGLKPPNTTIRPDTIAPLEPHERTEEGQSAISFLGTHLRLETVPIMCRLLGYLGIIHHVYIILVCVFLIQKFTISMRKRSGAKYSDMWGAFFQLLRWSW